MKFNKYNIIFSMIFTIMILPFKSTLVHGQEFRTHFFNHYANNFLSNSYQFYSPSSFSRSVDNLAYFQSFEKIKHNNQQSIHFSNRLLINFYGTAVGFGLSFMVINLLSHGSLKTRDIAKTWLEKNYQVLTYPLSVLSGSTTNMLFSKYDKMKTFFITTGLASTEMILVTFLDRKLTDNELAQQLYEWTTLLLIVPLTTALYSHFKSKVNVGQLGKTQIEFLTPSVKYMNEQLIFGSNILSINW